MPQCGNKCPGLNQFNDFDKGYCLNGCERQCVPASVLVQIENAVKNDKHVGKYLSVTSLLGYPVKDAAGCLRQTYLQRVLDYYQEPSQMWYAVRGKILHHILQNPGFDSILHDADEYLKGSIERMNGKGDALRERWAKLRAELQELGKEFPNHPITDWLSEQEYEYPLGHIDGEDWFLRGTLDVIRPMAGHLLDYKTIGDKGLPIIARKLKPEHVIQVNTYRLMAERGYPVGQKDTYKPIIINKITLFYMTMMQIVGTGNILEETTRFQIKNPDPQPNEVGRERIATIEKVVPIKRGRVLAQCTPEECKLVVKNRWKIKRLVPEVPLLNLDEVEKMIKEAAPILVAAFNRGVMPPMCAPEHRAWKCDAYCPIQIREACDAYNETVGEKRVVEEEEEEV